MKTQTIPRRVLAVLCAFLILCVCLSSALILSVSANSTTEQEPVGPIEEDGKLYVNFADTAGWIETVYTNGGTVLDFGTHMGFSNVSADGKSGTVFKDSSVAQTTQSFAMYPITVDLSKYNTLYLDATYGGDMSRVGVTNQPAIFVGDNPVGFNGPHTGGNLLEADLSAAYGTTGEITLYVYVGLFNAMGGDAVQIHSLYFGKKEVAQEPVGPIEEDGKLYVNFADTAGWIETVYTNGGTVLDFGTHMGFSNVSADGKSGTVFKDSSVAQTTQSFAMYPITVDLSKYNTLYLDATYGGDMSRVGVTNQPAIFVGDNPVGFNGPHTGGNLLEADLSAAYGTTGEITLYVYVGLFNAMGGDAVQIHSLYFGKKEVAQEPVGPIEEDGKLYVNFADTAGWIETVYTNGGTVLDFGTHMGFSNVSADGKSGTVFKDSSVAQTTQSFAMYPITVDLSKYNTLYLDATYGGDMSRVGVTNQPAIFVGDNPVGFNGPHTGGNLLEADLSAAYGTTGEITLYVYVGLFNAMGGDAVQIHSLYFGKKEVAQEPVEDYELAPGYWGGGLGTPWGDTTVVSDEDTATITAVGNGVRVIWVNGATMLADSVAKDLSAYKYLTMTVEVKSGTPFVAGADKSLIATMHNSHNFDVSSVAGTVDFTALADLPAGYKQTVSLPISEDITANYLYLCVENCGAAKFVIHDARFTVDDRTSTKEEGTPDVPVLPPEEEGDFVMDLDALGAGNGDPTKYTYDPETGIGHVEYTNQMWLYWTLWSSDRWATNPNPVNLTTYNYLTMKVRMDKSNAFAATSAPTITLANDGGVAVNNPWNGLGVYTARLEAITEADGWVTVSLPFKTSETTSAYYAMLLCDMCGNGGFSIADMRLTEDDRTDEAFKNVGGDEANPYDDLILDLGAWGAGYDSTTSSYDSHTGILKADYNGMLWLYWTSWSDKSYTDAAFNTADYEYLTMTLRVDENNPFATASNPVLNLCNDGGVAINNPYAGVAVSSTLLKAITQDNGWVTLSLPLKDSADKDFWYAMLQAENCGEGTLEIKDCRLTRDDRTSIYTGEEWDPAKGIWLDVTGWSNHYPQGVTGTNNIFDDSLKLDVHGNVIYCWTAWSSERAEDVVDFSDYPYLTLDVCLTGGNPFKNSSDAGLACGLFICDEGGISVSNPYDFGSALMDNLCQVRPGDEWVTVSLSLENVEQSTLRYISMVAENCGVDMSVLIRNMRLTENDETPDFIKKRVEDAKNADKGDASEEESFFDPDDVLDDYAGREEQQPSDESSAPEEDVESSKPADDSSDPVDTGVVLPIAAMLTGALSLGAVSVLRKKRR